MSQAIYGSNMQEKASLDLEYTMRACDVVFSGASGDAATIQKQIEETHEDHKECRDTKMLFARFGTGTGMSRIRV